MYNQFSVHYKNESIRIVFACWILFKIIITVKEKYIEENTLENYYV